MFNILLYSVAIVSFPCLMCLFIPCSLPRVSPPFSSCVVSLPLFLCSSHAPFLCLVCLLPFSLPHLSPPLFVPLVSLCLRPRPLLSPKPPRNQNCTRVFCTLIPRVNLRTKTGCKNKTWKNTGCNLGARLKFNKIA